jgi:hypothetical protein
MGAPSLMWILRRGFTVLLRSSATPERNYFPHSQCRSYLKDDSNVSSRMSPHRHVGVELATSQHRLPIRVRGHPPFLLLRLHKQVVN